MEEQSVQAEEIVVSGMSGRLPESDNLEEFWQHLINKDNLVTEDSRRWEPGILGLPPRNGKLKDISRFDAAFFGVHPKQANLMDPQLRILLEVAYEAVLDGGVNPKDLRGTNTGVYIGCSMSEATEAFGSDPDAKVGYAVTGTNRTMLANRLSYFFDLTGPSYSVDTACSSAFMALHHAIQDIRRGVCDRAIVGAANLLTKPQSSLLFLKLGVLAPDGQSKSFDESGNGYCRSEGIVAMYITRESLCCRAYGYLVNSGTNTDGFKDQGITYPSGAIQQQLLRQVYGEAGVHPDEVEYFEAHGTGTKVGDPEETNGIAGVFCENRTQENPLLIGSVKSNMGHSEASSGLAALAKVMLTFNHGVIPPNLHFKSPNPDITALVDGRMKVVVEPTQFNGGYVGISSFGFGGSNVHILVKPFQETRVDSPIEIPRLIACGGRTEEGVQKELDFFKETLDGNDYHCLISNIASVQGMGYHGYTLLNASKDISEIKVSHGGDNRPIWYVFSGMGSQWAGMGKDLMVFETFKKSIRKSHEVLKNVDPSVDLLDIICNSSAETYASTVNSFTAIASIHVALVDCLQSVGMEPDGIIGHSVGELGCGYADGGLTAEQTVLAAYWRGRCVVEAKLPPGAMAAVGLTWEETKKAIPKGVVAACHNGEETITISGDKESVDKFVAQMEEEGVFARNVNSSGVAFHSHHMAKIAPQLQKALDKVITTCIPRSSRWISTSIPEASWDTDLAKWSSAAYQVNNLVSPVLFQEGLAKIPTNAIVVEIAPHCLMQAVLKRALTAESDILSLMSRKEENHVEFFLSNLGKLHLSGAKVDIRKLYPEVRYPVGPRTPVISPGITWDHNVEWDIPNAEEFLKVGSSSPSVTSFTIDASPEGQEHFIHGHCIDGRVLYPATGYLCLAWKALARMHNVVPEQLPVEFRDVNLHRATIVPKSGTVTLDVRLAPASNGFEISEGDQLTVSGKILIPDEPFTPESSSKDETGKSQSILLDKKDVYKELRLRGYDYKGEFQGIAQAQNDGKQGHLTWTGNWVSFMDTMLQMTILQKQAGGRCLRLPTRIRSIRINPLLQSVLEEGESAEISVTVSHFTNTCTAGGVEISGLHTSVAPRRQAQHKPPTLEQFGFIPNHQSDILSKKVSLQMYMNTCQLYAQHVWKKLECLLYNNNEENKKSESETLNTLEVEGYLKDAECGYLQLIHKIGELGVVTDLKNAVRKLVSESKESLAKDKVLQGLVGGNAMKNTLDIMWENTRSQKMKVVEIGSVLGQLFRVVVPFLNSQPLVEVDYTASDPSLSDLQEQNQDLESLNVKTVEWNVNTSAVNGLGNADLVVASNLARQSADISAVLETIHDALKKGGFLLLHEITNNFPAVFGYDHYVNGLVHQDSDMRQLGVYLTNDQWQCALQRAGFEVISVKSDGLLSDLILCRKPLTSSSDRKFIRVTSDDFAWVEEVKTAVLEYQDKSPDSTIWLVANGDYHNGIVGFVNCLRQEPGGEKVRCVFNADGCPSKFPDVQSECPEVESILRKNLVMNVYKSGQWGSYRHSLLETGPNSLQGSAEHAYVNVLTRGDLSSLRWISSPLSINQPGNDPDRTLCTIYYSSLNFRDIMLATGKLPPDALPVELAQEDCILGLEFSGRVPSGKRVMGLVPTNGLATSVSAESHLLFEIPDEWTMEEAATVPVVYCTAFYALVVRGQLRRGESVLIHSGSGGVGQAAISIALSYGCKVFTTVGTQEKREYLKKRFPALTDDCFANSRDLSFESHIMCATNGKGVNVVLNSLAAEKLEASLRVLSMHGRFLEIGKYDLSQNTGLGMALFLKNTSFHGVHLDRLMDKGNPDWPVVANLMKEGIKNGVVNPLQRSVFEREEVENAFRFMAQGKHIGKVVIQVREEETNKLTVPSPVRFSSIARSYCHADKVYIITGGLGGFGLELAHWLINRGAKKVVLTSRSGVKDGYQANCIEGWKEKGVEVVVSKRDVGVDGEAHVLIKESSMLGPVGGIFNLAMVLRDGMFENQNAENFQAVCKPKMNGTLYLDQATRELCGPELDWFVMFSSVSCGRGNAGQTNYGFANSCMERVCEKRQEDKLPGLAVQWGVIGDVGVVVDTMGGNETEVGGCIAQRIQSCLSTLDFFLSQPQPVLSSFVIADKKGPQMDQGPKVNLAEAVGRILGVNDPSSIGQDSTLADLGLDSLMGVEVKQTLERDYSLIMSMKEIRLLTMKKLTELSSSAAISDGDSSDGDQINTKVEIPLANVSSLLSHEEKNLIVQLQNGNLSKKGIFFIHPLEGTIEVFDTLCTQLSDHPCYAMQYTKDIPADSIQSIAQFYISKMKEIQPEGPYQVVGYSYGSSIAVEMATQLQRNKIATDAVEPLILLDGSPEFVSSHLHFFMHKYMPEEATGAGLGWQDGMELGSLIMYIQMYNAVEFNKMKAVLLSKKTHQEHLEMSLSKILESQPHIPVEDLRFSTDSFAKRVLAGSNYKTCDLYAKDIWLLKAEKASSIADFVDLGEDYNLKNVCSGKVHVSIIEGDHGGIMGEPGVSSIAQQIRSILE